MAELKLHVLKPSVNNMAVRVFVRAAKLDFVEDDVYGKTRTPEFLAMNPAHMTPMIETKGLPKGAIWERWERELKGSGMKRVHYFWLQI